MLITDLIREDHRMVHQLFLQLEQSARDGSLRHDLLQRIVDELEIHAQAEEEVFYPAVRPASRRIDDAVAAHAHLRRIVAEIGGGSGQTAETLRSVLQLKQSVLNHAAEEEAGIFMDAERLGLTALERLGAEMQERRQALQRAAEARRSRVA